MLKPCAKVIFKVLHLEVTCSHGTKQRTKIKQLWD